MDYNNNVNVELNDSGLSSFVSKVYGWMFAGLFTTAMIVLALMIGVYKVSSFYYFWINFISKGSFIFPIAEMVLVIVLSSKVNSMKVSTAKAMFIVYSVMNGLTIGISIVCLGLSLATVCKAFLMTAIMFGVMSVYGAKTKSDMTKSGSLFKMGLSGLLIVSVVNLFMRSNSLDWIICIVGMAIFLGLTAYDTKKIKQCYYSVSAISDTATVSKFAIIGALELYLDFINLFLYILRIFGKRNN